VYLCVISRMVGGYWKSATGIWLKFAVCKGRAIASAVTRRFPTPAARVRSCGIYGGQSDTGAGFLQVLRFPLPILIPPIAPHSSSYIIRSWYNRPNSVRRTKWTHSHPTPRNLKKITVSKRPNRVGVSHLTWGRKQIQLPKRCVL
jgi:hypothetical protein